MMSGVSDDFGRFQANARVILGAAYRDRPSVTEADIERWLGLFNTVFEGMGEHGLLRFYYHDGVRFAEWTNYMGDSESQREHHNCPEPEWSTHKHSKRCKLWGAAKAGVGSRGRSKPRSRGTSKTYVSVPSVPSVPTEPSTTATELRLTPPPTETAALTVTASDWNRDAADDFKAVYGVKPPDMFFAQVKAVAKRHGWAKTRPVLQAYMAETPIEFLNVAKCLESKVVNGAGVRGSPVNARARERVNGLNALIAGGMKGDGT